MVKITKIYKNDCSPCTEVSKILSQVKEPFELEELNIEDSAFKIRKRAKALLMKYATSHIPFILFTKADGTEYVAHYQEEGLPTVEIIEDKIKQGLK